MKELIGKVFGKVMVLDVYKINGEKRIYGICECGKTVEARASSYTRKNGTRACGCTRNVTHGKARSAEHLAWKNAKSRCNNPENNMYKTYGARGIKMCPEWENSFQKFFDYVGPKPTPNHSLDRINNDKGYEPGNVKWSNDYEQAGNKTNNRFFTICCQTKHLSAWARDFGVPYKKVHARISDGYSIIEALSQKNYLDDVYRKLRECNPVWCKHVPKCARVRRAGINN